MRIIPIDSIALPQYCTRKEDKELLETRTDPRPNKA